MDYRQELKYICTAAELKILEARLLSIMDLDDHLKGQSFYNIRSIYLDDYSDTFFDENEAGVNARKKIRIRAYNAQADVIKTEVKYKYNGMTRKQSCPINEQMCRTIMQGQSVSLLQLCGNPAMNLMLLGMHDSLLRPKVIVEYERTAFVSRTGNVRITFDQHIRASSHIERFFEKDLYALPVLEKGMHVLEIKYDELLPDHIAQALELGTLRQTAFSKYYLSRKKMEEYGYDL